MVAVGAVFRPQLPVALINVARGAFENLQPFGRLIDHQIDNLQGLAEILLQRLHVIAEAAEQKAAVGLKARELFQVMGALVLKRLRVAAGALIFRF